MSLQYSHLENSSQNTDTKANECKDTEQDSNWKRVRKNQSCISAISNVSVYHFHKHDKM